MYYHVPCFMILDQLCIICALSSLHLTVMVGDVVGGEDDDAFTSSLFLHRDSALINFGNLQNHTKEYVIIVDSALGTQ